MTRQRLIGAGRGLPWHLPEELQLFKRLTTGGTVIMGRKTHRAIGRPLPGRHNIVLSRSAKGLPGVQLCENFMAALLAAARQQRPTFVIGGAELYRKALPIAAEMHVSWIEGEYAGELYFPDIDFSDWDCSEIRDYPGFQYARYRRPDK